MNKNVRLYGHYQANWMPVIWIYSDPHFGDSDCKLMDPNWPTPEEQVAKINAKVGKNDTLIILGDIGDVKWVREIRCYHKVLVMGNHDSGASNYENKIIYLDTDGTNASLRERGYPKHCYINKFRSANNPDKEYTAVHLGYFDEIYDGPIFINNKVLLSHEPVQLNFGINIHGHSHDSVHIEKKTEDCASVNVCSNVIGFEPIRLDKLLASVGKVNDIHRVAVDKAIERKEKREK